MKLRPLHFVKETFTDLSGFKKRFLQFAIVLLVIGGGFKIWALVAGARPEGWTGSALTGGFGAIVGFAIGAAVRLVAKVGLLLAAGAAGVAWALGHFGIVDLPWDSYGQIYDDFALAVDRQTASLRVFLDGFLPAGGMTGLGLASGLTQKPGGDDDDDDN